MPLLDNDTQISVLVDGLDHPEGIAWGLDGYAYAGGEAGQVYRIDIERRELKHFADTGGFVLGMWLCRHVSVSKLNRAVYWFVNAEVMPLQDRTAGESYKYS